ncbi:MAG TPA: hypothetical protein VHT51_04285 [Micropepsaceae bacterium]|jgi:hypothetical protein|nr:hypothetical protein [Micropepsaceae bacterium]
MEYVVGISLALLAALFATATGFDRDRAFYPVVTVIVASYYELFAIMGGSGSALGWETAGFAIFVVVAVIGFKTNLWLIVAALAGHGLFDLIHSNLISDPGVPAWWPMFCLSYDMTAASYLAWRLSRSALSTQAPTELVRQSAGGMS